ncbi:hypothetical protein PP178_03870 [Zeaxanthinibacter sp. PT1]|uniref:hypothetical protein n=1 Tax=Zeaxanthinibacter TaxID=561554 RepID=UPI00234B4677|nr:hypothetical protein [Zeaxanthinibacter sp. PT1]MDC6350677.1 hypothetical protein [Zeaxanthinibacter sp. PT1]
MDIVEHGQEYLLANFGETSGSQRIRFTEKVNGQFIQGTTHEEVIDMLIDRFYALNKKSYSPINQCIILLLKNIRRLMKERLSKKIDRVIRYQEKTGTHE